jgi:hypothetical protein
MARSRAAVQALPALCGSRTPLSHVTVRRVLTVRATAGVNGRRHDLML